jgi:hypothetical protein
LLGSYLVYKSQILKNWQKPKGSKHGLWKCLHSKHALQCVVRVINNPAYLAIKGSCITLLLTDYRGLVGQLTRINSIIMLMHMNKHGPRRPDEQYIWNSDDHATCPYKGALVYLLTK